MDPNSPHNEFYCPFWPPMPCPVHGPHAPMPCPVHGPHAPMPCPVYGPHPHFAPPFFQPCPEMEFAPLYRPPWAICPHAPFPPHPMMFLPPYEFEEEYYGPQPPPSYSQATHPLGATTHQGWPHTPPGPVQLTPHPAGPPTLPQPATPTLPQPAGPPTLPQPATPTLPQPATPTLPQPATPTLPQPAGPPTHPVAQQGPPLPQPLPPPAQPTPQPLPAPAQPTPPLASNQVEQNVDQPTGSNVSPLELPAHSNSFQEKIYHKYRENIIVVTRRVINVSELVTSDSETTSDSTSSDLSSNMTRLYYIESSAESMPPAEGVTNRNVVVPASGPARPKLRNAQRASGGDAPMDSTESSESGFWQWNEQSETSYTTTTTTYSGNHPQQAGEHHQSDGEASSSGITMRGKPIACPDYRCSSYLYVEEIVPHLLNAHADTRLKELLPHKCHTFQVDVRDMRLNKTTVSHAFLVHNRVTNAGTHSYSHLLPVLFVGLRFRMDQDTEVYMFWLTGMVAHGRPLSLKLTCWSKCRQFPFVKVLQTELYDIQLDQQTAQLLQHAPHILLAGRDVSKMIEGPGNMLRFQITVE